MITRLAIFDGVVEPEKMEAFRASVEKNLVPCWRNFPGKTELKVLFSVERDEGAPAFPLIQCMTFPNRAALQLTLDAPLRMESRTATQAVCREFFTGVIHHHIMESTDYGL